MEYTVEGLRRRSVSDDRPQQGSPVWRRIASVVLSLFGLFAAGAARAVEADPVVPDGTTTYVLVTGESFITDSESQQTYAVEGSFDLTVDLDTGEVVISQADLRATAAEVDGVCIDMDALFALTTLEGRIRADGAIELWGTAFAGRRVDLTVTLKGDALQLAGDSERFGRLSSGHTLEALAWRQYGGEVTIPDGRSVYTFLPDESTLLQVGGFFGIHRTDPLHGWFELAIDLEAGTGSFASINAKPIYDDSGGGGAGEPNSPYLIYTAEQMNAIGAEPNDWGKHFSLMDDIDLAPYGETSFNTIGADVNTPFTGVFEGNDHVISNFHHVKEGTDHTGYPPWDTENVGLFCVVDDPNAVIRNISLEDPNVYAPRSTAVGTLIGYLRHGALANCHAIGGRVSAFGPGGGLVGRSNGAITVCSASAGSVTGNSNLGGLVGLNSGTISACQATSDVDGGIALGGLVGINGGDIIACQSTGGRVSGWAHLGGLIGASEGGIADCYTTNDVLGVASVGGLVGDAGGTIRNCYAAGVVSGGEEVGGLVGRRYRGQVVASFWDTETTGQTESAAGLGRTTLLMQTVTSYLEAGWDFAGEVENGVDDIWWMPEEPGYPRLWWERSADETPK